jgi:integrase/recombinase XerD
VTAVAWDRYPSVSSNHRARQWLSILADLGRAANTIDAYGRGLEGYLRFCQRINADLENASRAHVAAYVRSLADCRPEPTPQRDQHGRTGGLSNATMQQRLTVVRLFYDYLTEEGIRIDNPVGRGKYTPGTAFGGVRQRGLLPHYQKLPWIPGDDDWNAILIAARDEPLRNQVMLSLTYDGALRREEVCRLESRDIDPAHRSIRIRAEITKNRRERLVRYTESTSILLREYLGRRCPTDRSLPILFLSESRRNHGQPISIWTWSKTIKELARRTGLPRFTTHTPRHLRLTDLARADMDIHDIAVYAGHRSIQTTLLYIHLSGRDLARKYDRAIESIRRWRTEFPGGRPD